MLILDMIEKLVRERKEGKSESPLEGRLGNLSNADVPDT